MVNCYRPYYLLSKRSERVCSGVGNRWGVLERVCRFLEVWEKCKRVYRFVGCQGLIYRTSRLQGYCMQSVPSHCTPLLWSISALHSASRLLNSVYTRPVSKPTIHMQVMKRFNGIALETPSPSRRLAGVQGAERVAAGMHHVTGATK